MPDRPLSRRQFLGAAAIVGAAAVAPSAALGPSDPALVRPPLSPVPLIPEVLPPGVALQYGSGRFRSMRMVFGRFSDDSRWLVEYGQGRCIGYELASGRRVEFFTPTDDTWTTSHWLPTTDGRLSVIEQSGPRSRMRQYDLRTGAPLPPVPAVDGQPRALTADGKLVVLEQAREGRTGWRCVELLTGRTVWEREGGADLDPVDPTGRYGLANGLKVTNATLLELASGRTIPLTMPINDPRVFERKGVCHSADGQRISAHMRMPAEGEGRWAATWDTTTGQQVGSFPLNQTESPIGLSSQGDGWFAVDGDGRQLVVRDVVTGHITRRLPVLGVDASGSAVTPDGKVLVLARWEHADATRRDPENTTIRLIDADTGATLPQSPDPPGPIVRVWFPTRDTTAAAFRTRVGHLDYVRWDTASGRGLRVTDPTDRNEATRTADPDPVPLASPDLQHFLRPDGSHLVVLHGATGKAVARRERPSAANGRWFWLDAATVGIFALDGLHLWAWAADTSRLLPLVLPGKWPHVWRWRASADGRTLAVQFFPNLTGRACQVAWVDVPTGKVTTTEFGSNACGDWFGASVDANRLAVQLGKEVFHVHDRSGWRGMFRVPNALPKCDLTACGRTLAVQRDDWTDDEGVRRSAAFELWEVSVGQRRWSWPIDRAFDDLRASPCGRFVATARTDQPVYLWDVFGEVSDPQLEPTDDRRMWDALGSADAEVAFRAMRQLVQHSAAAVRLLSAKLKPAEAPKRAWVDERIEQLSDRDFHTRQTAEKELTARADVIAEQLRAALEAGPTTEEAEERLQRIVGRATAPLDYVRTVRAVEVLEYAGEAARPLLSRLANGAPGFLAREASSAMKRRDD